MILGSPQILSIRQVGGKCVGSQALSNTIPGSLKPDPRDPETETGNLEIEKRVHGNHGTLEQGLHKDPSQPSGPLKGGRRIRSPCWFDRFRWPLKAHCEKLAGSRSEAAARAARVSQLRAES